MILGTVQSAIVGGTISHLTGGKFANGARTGAFQFLFNKCLSSGCSIDKTFKRWGDMWSNFSDRVSNSFSGVNLKANSISTEDIVNGATVISLASGYGGLVMGSVKLGQVAIVASGVSLTLNPSPEAAIYLAVDIATMRLGASNIFDGTFFQGLENVISSYSLMGQAYEAANEGSNTNE